MEDWQERNQSEDYKKGFPAGHSATIAKGILLPRDCAKMPRMKTLFDDADRASLLNRLGALQADSPRQWGKMNPAQMVTHCARALETATGDRPMKQKLIGKILMPFFRKSILGEKPFGKNGP